MSRWNPESLEEQFWKFIKKQDNGCWIWTGSIGHAGFGQLMAEGKNHVVHRLAFRRFFGDIPARTYILTKCGNRLCVSPGHLLASSDKIPRLIRFWKYVEKREVEQCWLWTGNKTVDGYGTMMVDNKLRRAHRISFELFAGAIPNGLCVLHRCDKPSCVNPDHLFLGTALDNNADRNKKGRSACLKGEEHGGAKLTESQVIKIIKSSLSCAILAKRYRVSPGNIYFIKERKTWRHIDIDSSQ